MYLKTIQHDAEAVDWGIGHHSIGSSGTYSFTATGLTQPSVADREQLLLAEATRLQQVGEQWNHQVHGLRRLSNAAKTRVYRIGEPLPEGNSLEGKSLAIVLPKWQGTPLSKFPREDERKLFPFLLPALWNALMNTHHGDLKPDSIFIDESKKLFRILDPGAYLIAQIVFTGQKLCS